MSRNVQLTIQAWGVFSGRSAINSSFIPLLVAFGLAFQGVFFVIKQDKINADCCVGAAVVTTSCYFSDHEPLKVLHKKLKTKLTALFLVIQKMY